VTRRSDIKLTRSRIPQASLRAAADNFCSSLQNKLKFNLLPALYLSPVYRGWFPTRQPFWGIVASATLLSVGPPSWFNMLRTYSNLRSILTNKEDKKCKEGAKKQYAACFMQPSIRPVAADLGIPLMRIRTAIECHAAEPITTQPFVIPQHRRHLASAQK